MLTAKYFGWQKIVGTNLKGFRSMNCPTIRVLTRSGFKTIEVIDCYGDRHLFAGPATAQMFFNDEMTQYRAWLESENLKRMTEAPKMFTSKGRSNRCTP